MNSSVAGCALDHLHCCMVPHTPLLYHPTPRSVLEAYLDGLVLLAGGRLCYCGPYCDGPAFLASCGHAQLPGQAPADFMLGVLSDPSAAAAAADAWQAAHPAGSNEGCKPATCSGEGLSATGGEERDCKDVESGSPAIPASQSMLAGTRLQGSLRRLRGAHLPVNSVSLIGELGGSGGGGSGLCAPLAQLLLEVWVLSARSVRWMRRQRGTTATIFATSAIGGGMLGALGAWCVC